MAAVHLGRLCGDAGFARPVAIKRLHAQFANDPDFVAMLLDEAHLASRLQHPNCVAPRDVVVLDGEVFVVMDYVHGVTLSQLIKAAQHAGAEIPLSIVCRIMSDMLAGLHAAHHAADAVGRPLELVHRDVSPQNVIVGSDGLSRVIDFGIAQAAFRSQTTREGHMKGKLAYAAPEQIADKDISHLVDVYAAGVVCWEAITSQRLFTASSATALYAQVVENAVRPMRPLRKEVPLEFEAAVMSALNKQPTLRPASAEHFAALLEAAVTPASAREVAKFVDAHAGQLLESRRSAVREVERGQLPMIAATGAIPVPPRPALESVGGGEPEQGTVTIAGAAHTSTMPVSAARPWRRGAGLALFAVVGVGLLGFVIRSSHARSVEQATVEGPTSLPPANVQQREEVPVVAANALRVETASVTPIVTAIDTAPTAPAATSAPARSPSLSARALASRPKPAGASAPNCSSLYETDANGVRHVKRECLRKLGQP